MAAARRSHRDAESLFADFLARREGGDAESFDALVAEHPDDALELRALHVEWREFEAIVERATAGRLFDEVTPTPASKDARDDGEDLRRDEALERWWNRRQATNHYQLRGLLGRGGMGAVLEVWDKELKRTLAMKVALDARSGLPANADRTASERAAARFLDEAHITAQLDHPGIVPVHELGRDAAGRPYFTMRLVKGESFQKVIEHVLAGTDGWTRLKAIDVLLKCCDALAYAHSRGVVHRDVKPANVMVGSFGEVYVVDWGLARVLAVDALEEEVHRETTPRTVRAEIAAADDDSPLFTNAGDVLGTPVYMSPEQARGDRSRVGIQSDVYSVGAMLYHLLEGRAPYFDESATADPREICRRVREEPPEPLDRAGRDVPAELVSIVAKAMARDPAKRHESCGALGADLRAYLEGRVVAAHEQGTWAETRKWMKRNRALAFALVATILATTVGAVGFSIKADEATEALALANESAQRAAVERDRAEHTVEFVANALRRGTPQLGGSQNYLVVDAMEVALADLERPETRLSPAARAGLLGTISIVLRGNGRTERALPIARASLDAFRALHQDDHLDVGRAESALASCLQVLGRYDEALAHNETAEALFERLGPSGAKDRYIAVGNTVGNLMTLSRHADAMRKLETALEESKDFTGEDLLDRAGLLPLLGACRLAMGRPREAMEPLREALAVRRAHSSAPAAHIAMTLNVIASCSSELSQHEEALNAHREVLALRQALYAGDHHDIANVLSNIGSCLDTLGRRDEALEILEGALAMRRRLFAGDHPDVALSLNLLAGFRRRGGQPELALPLYEEALGMRQALFAGDHVDIASSLRTYGSCLSAVGRTDTAIVALSEAVGMYHRLFPDGHPRLAASLNDLGLCLREASRFDDALRALQAAMTLYEQQLGPEHLGFATSVNNVGLCLSGAGRIEDALSFFQRALDVRRCALPDGHAEIASSLTNVAYCYERLRRRDEAIAMYLEAAHQLRAAHPLGHPMLGSTLNNLSIALVAAGRPDEAARASQESVDNFSKCYSGDHVDLANALTTHARALLESRRIPEALERAERASEMAKRVGAADHLVRATSDAVLRRVLEARSSSEGATPHSPPR